MAKPIAFAEVVPPLEVVARLVHAIAFAGALSFSPFIFGCGDRNPTQWERR